MFIRFLAGMLAAIVGVGAVVLNSAAAETGSGSSAELEPRHGFSHELGSKQAASSSARAAVAW